MESEDADMDTSFSEQEYTASLHLAMKQAERHEREIHRLKNSVTYRLGEHLTASARRPWKLLFLPLTFPYHSFLLGLEKIGMKAPPNSAMIGENSNTNREDCVVLFPTNGVGFGHFTRMYSVAKAIRRHSPNTEVIFFTPMPTLHIPYSDNFPTYHIAGRYKFKEMSSSQWNGLIEEQLLMIFDIHKPKLFMFDGAYPYRGMLNAIRRNPNMRKAWMRRGMFKKGSKIPVDSIQYFDTVIHPGDAVTAQEQELDHSVEVMRVPPILLVKEEEMLSKEEARSRLGVPLVAEGWYVQLGAGQINDIDSEIRLTIDALLEHNSDLFIVIGESLLGKRVSFSNERVRILRDYPNAIYFNGFDYSIQAGGYNSFHEMRISRIPTIFYPNMNTGMDDQLARCKVSVNEGWGVVVGTRTKKNILSSIAEVQSLNPNDDITLDEISGMDWVESLLS